MDRNLAALGDDDWDPFETVGSPADATEHEDEDEDEVLDVEEVGALLAALDQGGALLALTGTTPSDAGLLRTGLRRLVDPVRAATEGRAEVPPGAGPIHDPEIQRRVLRDAPQR